MPNKQAYALLKNGQMVDCFFSKSKAVRYVDDRLGNGLFSPKWEDDKKGEYTIVPCEVFYDKLYVLSRNRKTPRFFASLDEIIELLKKGGVKVKKRHLAAKSFVLDTDRGSIKGEIVQVK